MIFSLAILFVSVLTFPYAYTHSTIQSAAITSSKHTSHTQSSATSVPRINYPYSQMSQEDLHTPQSISQCATITSSTNASHLQTSSTAPAKSTAASHRGAGDPCGPEGIQTDFESTLDTCGQINTTFTNAPSIYGVQCLHANPSWNQSVNTTSCASNIDDICGSIVSRKATVSEWTWSSGAPNCTMGIWFNPLPAAQPPLTLDSCRAKIYQLMQLTCFPSEGGPFNVAAVNLQTLPDAGTNGSQVDPGYPSYIIVPETYDDVFTDVPADGETGDGDGDEGEY